MTTSIMNIQWIETYHFEAFKALPECYQADSCLEFWIDEHDFYLKCGPKPNQQFALGYWIAYYDPVNRCWLDELQGSEMRA